VADVGEEMSLGSPAKFDQSINSKFNESTQSLLKMEKYFTRNNYLDGKKEKTERQYLSKNIQTSLENDKWVNITELLSTVIITVQPTYFK
jgi:hypothetical protein